MELTLDELKALSGYFNSQPSLPQELRGMAVYMKEMLNPIQVELKKEVKVKKVRISKK